MIKKDMLALSENVIFGWYEKLTIHTINWFKEIAGRWFTYLMRKNVQFDEYIKHNIQTNHINTLKIITNTLYVLTDVVMLL